MRRMADIELKKPLSPIPDVIPKQTYFNPLNTNVAQKTLMDAKVQSSPLTNLSVKSAPKITGLSEVSQSKVSSTMEARYSRCSFSGYSTNTQIKS